MGLSSHYSGHIRDKNLLNAVIEEVKDICETLIWAPQTIEGDKIRVVCFAPEGSESILLTFNNNGRLLSLSTSW